MAKMTTTTVAAIKARLEVGERQQALAMEYDISQAMVSEIKTGKRWSHIPPKYDPTIATDPVTLETVYIRPDPKPLPREDGAQMQRGRRITQLLIEGDGIRPCLSAANQWLGCPYPGSSSLCDATRKVVNGQAMWLDCLFKPGVHHTPEGYDPPKPKDQATR